MIGRSVSYTDTSALHEYLCTLIQNGHKYCKLLIKQSCFQIMFKNIIIKSLKNCEKVCETRTVLYQCIQTLIKHVFAFNFLRWSKTSLDFTSSLGSE